MEDTTMVLVATLGCNSNCIHCCLSCEMQKASIKLSDADMVDYIKQGNKKGIKTVTFTGGEPMLLDLSIPMAFANELGMYIDLRTNAFWARSYDEAYSTLEELKKKGLQRLGLSFDNYHANFIPMEYVINALQASRCLNIPLYIDWIGIESYEQVLRHLNVVPVELRYVGTPLRVGRATKLRDNHFKWLPVEAFMSNIGCGQNQYPFLTIYPGGYMTLHPCCWVNPALVKKVKTNGNDWISTLSDKVKISPMVNFFRCYGLGGLIEKAKMEKPDILKSVYSHQCEVCFDLLPALFPEEVEEVPQYISDFRG